MEILVKKWTFWSKNGHFGQKIDSLDKMENLAKSRNFG